MLYLLISGSLTIPAVAYLLVIAYLTTTIKDILVLIKEVLTKAIDKLYNILK